MGNDVLICVTISHPKVSDNDVVICVTMSSITGNARSSKDTPWLPKGDVTKNSL